MRKDRKRIVIAVGGNAIKLPHRKGTYEEQFENVRLACKHIIEIIKKGFEVVVTHGNGPQVGNLLIQQEAGSSQVPVQPMDICSAMTQGQLGYLLQQALMNELKLNNLNLHVATMVTQILVDGEDPDFANPSKPVGPFYSRKTKGRLESERGYRMKQVLPNGEDEPFRRVVPSPDPIRILEVVALKTLVDSGTIVIAAGGGGIPVVLNDHGEFEGVEGVMDKDLAAEKLAEAVNADILMILTDVPKVKIHFGSPHEKDLDQISIEEAKRYLEEGHFWAGTMAPKILACVRFIEYGGEEAIIASLENAVEAIRGGGGTHIIP
jgi:carbamate kinase